MKSKNVFFFILLCLLTSCSFNHQFYDTEKIPATVKQERIITKTGDTTYLNIGRGYQPSFTDNKNNPLPLSYTFESINFKNSKGDNLVGWFAKPKVTDEAHRYRRRLTRRDQATRPRLETRARCFSGPHWRV